MADSILKLLAEGLAGTVPELLGAMLQLEVPAREEGRPINAHQIRDFLSRRDSALRPKFRDIATLTARHFALRLGDLQRIVAAAAGGGRSRRGNLSLPAAYAGKPGPHWGVFWRPRPHDRPARLPQDGGIAPDRPCHPAGDRSVAAEFLRPREVPSLTDAEQRFKLVAAQHNAAPVPETE